MVKTCKNHGFRLRFSLNLIEIQHFFLRPNLIAWYADVLLGLWCPCLVDQFPFCWHPGPDVPETPPPKAVQQGAARSPAVAGAGLFEDSWRIWRGFLADCEFSAEPYLPKIWCLMFEAQKNHSHGFKHSSTKSLSCIVRIDEDGDLQI